MTDQTTLFCPLHGDYVPEADSSKCPRCAVDPIASSASLRRVRVVKEGKLAPVGEAEGADQLTPMTDEFPCPVCGQMTMATSFRTESVGEVWTGNAAVWAEEGVCPDCYRDVLNPQIREWSDAEWLTHHYEGWKATVETVHNIFIYEESPQESWLPEAERPRVLDVERTLSERREHLARCQMTMRDLQGRYRADLTPPPFQMTLALGSDSVSPKVVAELQAMRERDVAAEMRRRNESVVARAPVESGEFAAPLPTITPEEPDKSDSWVVPMAVLAAMATLAAIALWWSTMR